MKVAIIGCGVMGSAFARQFAKHGHSLILCDHNHQRTATLAKELSAEVVEDPSAAAKRAEVVVLGIKPKDLKALATKIGQIDGPIFFSMIMGVSVAELRKYFGKNVVRSMPNLALKHGASVIALVKDPLLPKEMMQKIDHLLEGLGLVFWTEEAKIDPITALAGSGPAFVIGMIEAMTESGIAMGLRADEAKKLSMETIRGALALIEQQEGHPGIVRWEICAPGGSTIAGMCAFEEAAVRAGIINTFIAAYDRVRGKS